MTNLHNYTDNEHRRVLPRILREVMASPCHKAGCPGSMDYQPPYPAEPDTGTAAWPGGATCDVCGHTVEDEPRDEDTAAAMCVPVVRLGPGGDFTRDWPERKKG